MVYNTKCWQRCEANGTLIHCWSKCILVWPTLEDNLAVSYKTKHAVTIRSSNHVPWYLNIELKTNVHTRIVTCTLMAALFIIAKTWKQQIYPSVGEWTNKLCYIQAMEYYLVLKTISYQDMKKHGGNLKANF